MKGMICSKVLLWNQKEEFETPKFEEKFCWGEFQKLLPVQHFL